MKVGVGLLLLAGGLAAALARTSYWPLASEAPAEVQQDPMQQLWDEIRGADLNHNGVRDDVESWILERSEDGSADRRALLQLAADYQSVLTTTSNAKESQQSLLRLSDSRRCLERVAGAEAEPQIVHLKAVVLDTDVRVRAWLKAYDRLEKSGIGGGQTSSTSGCRF
ncbi:MAG: hypothetical protein IT180_06175 [Acidobacteria bacterium]|nr:hypothetical protein [Acidobacteriota bacterium]